ncbi:MAG: OmpA family protein [Bacteroidia bacterium]|nr:OmpA family protein [Bacteroidia bacterium]
MHKILLFVLGCFCFSAVAQDDKSTTSKFCKEDIDKKAMGLYEKGTNKKKYEKQERLEFLTKCLQIDPEFAEANLAMGLELAGRCKLLEKPFTPTLPFFYKAIANCPSIHSEPYYYLGFDYYERQLNDSAIKYLKKFVDFKDDNEKKFSYDYSGEMYNAKMMLKSAKKELSLKKNVPFNPRVVNGVSTERDEYLAYISPDDKSCYFVRRVPAKNMNQVFESDKEKEVFMIANREKNGQFNNGQPMDAPFNVTDDNQGGCSISIDNKRLYFAMMKQEGGLQPNCDIYVTEYANDSWGDIKKVSPLVNDPKYWDSQPTIASDGVTLYFASDRPGGFGGIDLYYTKRDPKTNTWSVPHNLGPNINTKGDEKTPFIHSDSETLYFSSNGQYGFGGYDIYYVRKNEKGEWDEPVNIGSPINSPEDDAGFFVSSDTQTGYFFSYDEGKVKGKGAGRWDLFGFALYKEARPQEINFVKGIAKKDSVPLTGAVVEITDLKTKVVSYANVDSSSGEYMLAIKKQSTVLVTVKKDSIAFNSRIIRGSEVNDLSKAPTEINLDVAEAKTGNPFVINDIHYKTNSADLTDESQYVLESFAKYLKEHPKMKIEINGHTDNVGNVKDNEALSSNRAFSVKAVIEGFGVDGHRITAKGFGPNNPIADNNSEEGRAKNRRTEFVILTQ